MKKIAVLTSGGDAPGMNAAVRAVVRTAIAFGMEVYGIERGYAGMVNGDIFLLTNRSVSDIIHRGGTFLKTARCLEFKNKETRKIAVDNLKKFGIEGLVVVGGDGSFQGGDLLSNEFGIKVMGIPGTIDNDLAYTDYTLGFDTAVNTVLWAVNSIRDTMTSHDRVSVIEVMGRHCGDIALYSGLASGAEYILTPEVPFDLHEIAENVKKNSKNGKTSTVIILAEGAGKVEEVVDFIKNETGADVKGANVSYIQRGGAPSMFDRVLASKMGYKAVELLRDGADSQAIGIRDNKIISIPFNDVPKCKKEFNKKLYDMALTLSL